MDDVDATGPGVKEEDDLGTWGGHTSGMSLAKGAT